MEDRFPLRGFFHKLNFRRFGRLVASGSELHLTAIKMGARLWLATGGDATTKTLKSLEP
jgi:hypothetical protein